MAPERGTVKMFQEYGPRINRGKRKHMKFRATSGSGNRKGIEEEGEEWADQNALYICMKFSNSNKKTEIYFFIFMFMHTLSECPQRLKKSATFPAAGVTNSCELRSVYLQT